MDYARSELVDRLAASYVAGTLRGPARRRFEALLAAHPGLREATRQWEQRLMPLTQVLTPQRPSARVWSRIMARIDGTAAAPGRGWGASLAFWRGWAGVTSVGAVALVVALAMPSPVQPPVVVVLSAPQGAAAGTAPMIASISGDGRALVTRPIVNVAVQPDRSLELWAIAPGSPPRSLGVISPEGTTVVQRQEALAGADTLAVTVEAPGGSPDGKPAGPVVYAGKFSL